jgi:outer membrane protein OmpA-like peptidoglycan-associated protein
MKLIASVSLILALVLAGCQTPPKTPAETKPAAATPAATPAPTPAAPAANPEPAPAPTATDVNAITVGDTGFSPLAQAPHNFLMINLHFARPDAVKTWSVAFTGASGPAVRTVTGAAPQLPPSMTWDGNGDDGKPAPEGNYKATLSVDYGADGGVVTTDSASFLLDFTPPSGTISVTPQPWLPGDPNLMVNPPQVTIAVNVVPGIAAVASWRLFVIHPNGTQFMDFISEDHKDNQIVWTGRANNNASLENGVTYNLTAQVFDRYGNVGTLKGTLDVAPAAPVSTAQATAQAESAPVTVTIDGQLVASTQIYFPAYSADLSKVGPAKKGANMTALDTLAAALKGAAGTKIKVIGHANKVFWQDKAKGDREQQFTLIPLSKARAEAVRDELVKRGVDSGLFELTGVGADGNLAPFGDVVNNWKNRRVEFVLETGSTN